MRADINKLQEITWNFFEQNKSAQWKEPFNQCTFFNYDTGGSLYIQQWTLPPATIVTISAIDFVYPSFLELSGNAGEINTTNFFIDTKGSATGSWRVIYSQYAGVQ